MIQDDDQLYRIESLNWQGLGVTRVQGKVRCIPLTRPNESVAVKWHDAGWGRWIGERLDDDETALKIDQNIGCQQARRCSGCSLRHLSDQEQKEAQEQSHLSALKRLSGRKFEGVKVHWLDHPKRDGYRVRVTAGLWTAVFKPTDSTQHQEQNQSTSLKVKTLQQFMIGLRARWGEAIDLSKCPNHPLELRELVTATNRWINLHRDQLGLNQINQTEQQSSNPYFSLTRVSLQAGGGLPTWLVLSFQDMSHRGSLKRGQVDQRIELGQRRLQQLVFHDLFKYYPELSIYAEAKLQDQAQSSTGLIRLAGPPPKLWYCDRGLAFVARPPAWLPQSPSTLESLRKTVAQCLWGSSHQDQKNEEIAKKQPHLVFELGCGVGVLGMALAQEYPQISWIGVDLEEEAVACAQESALLNHLEDRVQFFSKDGRRGLAEVTSPVDSLVVHAMRKPLSGLFALAATRNISRICYLAPSAPSLARDLAEDQTYQVDQLYFIDQMPGTAQAMTIAQLSLVSALKRE